MANIRLISFYLGLNVTQDLEKKILKLSQPIYIDKISAKFHLDQAKTSNMLMKKTTLLPNKGKKVTIVEKNIIKE